MGWALAFAGAALLIGFAIRRLAQAASRRRARQSAAKRSFQLQQAARTRRGGPGFDASED